LKQRAIGWGNTGSSLFIYFVNIYAVKLESDLYIA